jgi:hypothetical protein
VQAGVKVWAVIVAIILVVGGIADMLGIFEFLERHASEPARQAQPGPAAERELPKASRHAAEQAQDGTVAPATPPEIAVRTETESHEQDRRAPEPAAESLINDRAVPTGSVPVMAVALDGEAQDVDLLEAQLAQGVSSAELRLVPGVFKPAFRERGFLRAAYDGDASALIGSGIPAAIARFLIGRVERSCRKTGQFDSDLVTCEVRLSFKVFDRHGAVADAGHVSVSGAGFSEDAARDRAVEMLVQQHGRRFISSE